MTKLLPDTRVTCRFLCAAALLLALAACGPGSGGTGTGPIAVYTSLTTSVGAGGSSSVPPVVNPAPADGCTGACGRIDLQLQEGRVEAAADCGRFVFIGNWEADANGLAVLPGTMESLSGGGAAPATLSLQFSGASPNRTVVVTLLDSAGAVVVGPEMLAQATALAPRAPGAACPP